MPFRRSRSRSASHLLLGLLSPLLAVVSLLLVTGPSGAQPTTTDTAVEPTTGTTAAPPDATATETTAGQTTTEQPSTTETSATDGTDSTDVVGVAPGERSDLDGRIQILGIEEGEAEVVLEVAVPPAIGQSDLGADNFGVADGGQLVDFLVEPVSTAADTVVVLDTSGSMRGSALDAAKEAAARFIEALPEDTRVGLISFDEEVEIHQTPTLDRNAVLTELEVLAATGNETALWDALLEAAEVVSQVGAERSSIVVLSDGDDTISAASPAAVVDRLGDGASALYAVAIESRDTNLATLEDIVGQVSGQFLATTDIGQLEQLYTDIAGRLANRYRIRFVPLGTEERTVVVSVAAGSGIATARAVIGSGGPSATVPASTPAATVPDTVLNLDDQPVLGLVPPPTLGWLASPVTQWIGLGSMFAALSVTAWALLARPATGVRLDAASGADRIGGINVRLGHAADRLITQHDRRRRLDRRLEAADIHLRPGEFVVGWLVATTVAVMTIAAFVSVTAGVLIIPVTALIALVVLNSRADRRQAAFTDQLTETLGIMASSLRSGQSLPKAIELVAAEAPSPTAEQFHRISFEVRVGRDLTESIRDAATRMNSADLEWLAQAVDIHRELGGDLTEIMDNVSATIRERRTVARQIQALSAEGRATGWILLAMPILLFFITWWRTPSAVEVMFAETLGRVLLGIALVGMVLGHLWIRRLVKFKY